MLQDEPDLTEMAALVAALAGVPQAMVILDDGRKGRFAVSVEAEAAFDFLARESGTDGAFRALDCTADGSQNPALCRLARTAGFSTLATVPVPGLCGAVVGWFCLGDQNLRQYEASVRALLTALARQAGALLATSDSGAGQVLADVGALLFRVRLDEGFSLESISDRAGALLGVPADELLSGRVSALGFVHPGDQPRLIAELQNARESTGVFDGEYRLCLADGQEKWVWARGSIRRDNHNKPCALEGFALDVTDRKRFEGELSGMGGRIRQFLREAPVALAVLDENLRFLEISRRWESLFSVSRASVLGLRSPDVALDLPAEWLRQMERALAGENVQVDADYWEREDGWSGWFRRELRPWYRADGSVGGLIITNEAVSEQKITELILRMLSVEAGGADQHDFLRLCTRRLSEILNVEWVQIARPCADDPRMMETLAVWADGAEHPGLRYMLEGTPCDMAYQQEACLIPQSVQTQFPADQDLVDLGIEAYGGIALKGREGNLLGLLTLLSRRPQRYPERLLAGMRLAAIGIGAALDRQRAEQEVLQKERFNRALLDALDTEIGVLDEDGRVVFFNRSWEELTLIDALKQGSKSVGLDYLALCEDATEQIPEAMQAVELLRRVLARQQNHGSFEYLSSMRDPPRWFKCSVKRFAAASQDGRDYILVAYEDITEAKLARRRSDQVQQQFKHLFNAAPDAILMIDHTGQILLANQKCAEMFGYEQDDLTGRQAESLMAFHEPARQIALRTRFGHVLQQAAVEDLTETLICVRKDGSQFPAELSLSRFSGEGEEYGIAAVRDITLRQQAETDRLARQVAEEANQAKSAFLATMSHEIRTPLSAVLGLADVLTQSELTRDQAQLLHNMRESAGHLLRLIDDVLDFSKIEAGSLEIERAPVALVDVIESTGRALAHYAAEREVGLHVHVSADMPARALTDEIRLRQILYNLLGNAIKFTGGMRTTEGYAALRATVVPGPVPMLALEFRDNGIGMNQAVQAKLFSPFTQGEEATTRKFGGTGLGLTICKRIIDRMGGSITVESVPDEGSTFMVYLPLEVLEPAAPAQARLTGLRCHLMPSQMYFAEDLAAILAEEGAEVVMAAEATKFAGQAGDVLVIGAQEPVPEDVPEEMPRVLIGHGGLRRMAVRGRGRIFLEARAMSRNDLLAALALASGRESLSEPSAGIGMRSGAGQQMLGQGWGESAPILVAEDDAMNQKVILRQLDLLGLRAEVATNGAEALIRWREGRYALLLTDLHMPDMDGYALTRAIRAEEAAAGLGARLPILALTANALRDEVSRARAIGMDGYLTKPIALEKLAEALQPWLAALQGVQRAAGTPAVSAAPVIDTSIHAEMIGEDEAAVRDFLRAYHGVSLDLVGKFADAVGQGDSQTAAMIAHRLKSSSRWIGAGQFGDLCEALEGAAQQGDTALLANRLGEFRRQHRQVLDEIDRLCSAGTPG